MTRIIPTGCMEIIDHGRLEAYLGSCVGVVLWDRKAKIGGLMHILLPEPISEIPEADRFYYATEGLPVFIDRMTENTSNARNIEATIAGGALLGQVSGTDLELNIGGRISDICMGILKLKGISIKRVEVGGFLPIVLTLDVPSGTTTIKPVLKTTEDGLTGTVNPPTAKDITNAIEKMRPIPQIAIKVINMLSDGVYNPTEIADEIKKEQTLAARVLRLCNSSYIGLMRKVSSIEEALLYLGSKTILQVALTAISMEMFSGAPGGGYSLCKGGMYEHALGTARLAERLADLSTMSRPDIAYTAGLLHDIGKVVLDQYIATMRPLFYRDIISTGKDSTSIEKELLGIDHTEVGELLGKTWGIPDILVECVKWHHEPSRSRINKGLVHTVYLADLIMNKYRPDLEVDYVDTIPLKEALDQLGFDVSQLPEMIDLVRNIY